MTSKLQVKHGFWRTPTGLALGIFLFAALLLLVLEHRAHLLGAWPLLLLLLCAGTHLFMHRGHGSHAHDEHTGRRKEFRDGQ